MHVRVKAAASNPRRYGASAVLPCRKRLAVLLATVNRWRRRSRSRAELGEMDERALHDLGLSRTDATFEASKPFWRE